MMQYALFIYTSCKPWKSRVCVTLQNRLCLLLFGEYKQINKGGYVFGSVGLSVCLFVDNITQQELPEANHKARRSAQGKT